MSNVVRFLKKEDKVLCGVCHKPINHAREGYVLEQGQVKHIKCFTEKST